MGIFDDKKSKQIEYLEDERKKLWQRLTEVEKLTKDLQKEIVKTASESEKEAAQSSRKAAEFRNKTEQRLQESEELLSQIQGHADSVSDLVTKANQSVATADNEITRIQQAGQTQIDDLAALESRIDKLDGFLKSYPDLEDRLEQLDTSAQAAETNLAKSNDSLTATNKRRKEIEDLHREIFGYSETDANGKIIKYSGRKDDLDNTYKALTIQLDEADNNLSELNKRSTSDFKEFEQLHKKRYNTITEEIESLLPKALTAGLSAAFSSKKADEVESSVALRKSFSTGINMLIGVSLIPIIVSCFFLWNKVSLEEAINRLPRLVLAIIPMYIPVLWFTYSANKKLNLSKRLIEEYSHKEVISKTYEGLSKQINSINDPAQSEELRFKLLANFLQISSENPGKLISNYEASDHPIMEALEQGYRFQIAIDKLEGIPGLGKVAAILESKTKKKLAGKGEVIDKLLPETEQDGK
jgi:DNA repair exonuclease SbcCD ATPase subunit